ncbi:MAG TPA: hypothetical protein VJX10_22550 [Pseudonocardiaceae bacterium]|nr:hypothetical protein [Pseudonocardiaceae bacterium]
MHLSSLHMGAWASMGDDTEIKATNSDDMVTLIFGDGSHSIEVCFSGLAIDRLIEVATESRARLRRQ